MQWVKGDSTWLNMSNKGLLGQFVCVYVRGEGESFGKATGCHLCYIEVCCSNPRIYMAVMPRWSLKCLKAFQCFYPRYEKIA